MEYTRISSLVLNHQSGAKGGPGNTSPTKVKRVPYSVGSELDVLIDEWSARANASDSPRYHFLKVFMDELEEVLPRPKDSNPSEGL